MSYLIISHVIFFKCHVIFFLARMIVSMTHVQISSQIISRGFVILIQITSNSQSNTPYNKYFYLFNEIYFVILIFGSYFVIKKISAILEYLSNNHNNININMCAPFRKIICYKTVISIRH